MSKKKLFKKTLFIFRRDLRLADNIGLIAALKNSQTVIPCFIFDSRQCQKNTYKSMHAIQFMIESLEDLQQQLKKQQGKLFLFCGITEKVLVPLITKQQIDAIYFNQDYTPFSRQRDDAIAKLCQKKGIALETFADALLCDEPLVKADGSPYKVFSPFYKKAKLLEIDQPIKNNYRNYYHGNIVNAENNDIFDIILPQRCQTLGAVGGRCAALKKINHLKKITLVKTAPDYLMGNYTSDLSPHLKFNTCSVREAYHAIKKHVKNAEPLLRELYWRDFFTVIAWHLPQVFGNAYQAQYQQLAWHNDQHLFKAWCAGQTGFPIVDAAMRQLNQTGYMRNRLRLITASFLIKDLHIDWRWGEKYFAQQLIDYDPAVNNGNWQWVAGTGTDVQPYFRVFNPWRQQQEYDRDCLYIKKWLPELKTVSKKIIHQWYKFADQIKDCNYPRPLIDHQHQADEAKAIYRQARKKAKEKSSSKQGA